MASIQIHRAVILGATGPTGIHLADALLRHGIRVRAVGRRSDVLAKCFAATAVERLPADMREASDAVRAMADCEVAFDCIGLPAAHMREHPLTARRIADAQRATGCRCVHVSSYWAYLPVARLPVNEQHPRTGGPTPVRWRRDAEDILQDAGAAIAHLPDFYGPHVHTSTLQQALIEAATTGRFNWLGSPDVEREYVYVPDAMRMVAALARCDEAYGERWIVPGGGPLSARGVAAIASDCLHRPVSVRSAGPWLLRLISLFSASLRQFMPVVPYYLDTISFDGGKLRSLVPSVPITPYRIGIRDTLADITGQ